MPVVPADESSISQAAHILRGGGVVAFPTETVYGLGANALDPTAVAKIFEIKGRPSTNPLIVHVASFKDIQSICDPLSGVIQSRLQQLSRFWPGPLTVVLPSTFRLPCIVTAGRNSVGVRIPRHPVALDLLKATRLPLAAPSANTSTYVSPTTAAHVEQGLGKVISLILDGGPCEVGLESTIVSLLEVPMLLRSGAITLEEITITLGERVTIGTSEAAKKNAPALSPGLMNVHYAPKTRTVTKGSIPSSHLPPRTGLIAFDASAQDSDYEVVRTISTNRDFEEIARNLYSALRDLDSLNLSLIVLDTCTEEGLGRAIMDRVRRATSKI